MKRSNRLILLIGVLLAAVAFVGIVVFTNKGPGPNEPTAAPSTEQVVVAATNIQLGQQITASMVKYKTIQTSAALPDMYTDVGVVIGQTARANIASGAIIRTSTAFPTAGLASGQQISQNLNPGEVAIAVQVDQVSGVGTLIQAGDRVDLIFGQKIQQFVTNPSDPTKTTNLPGPNLSVKLVIQNARVLGTELPPPTTTTNQAAGASPSPGASPAAGTTSLNGQNQIAILAVTAQDAEAIRFQQLSGSDPTSPEVLSLVLRAPADASAPPVKTTGVVLQTLISQYGMLLPFPQFTFAP